MRKNIHNAKVVLVEEQQEQLATSFLFLTQGRDLKEWVPALLRSIPEQEHWHLFHALMEEYKTVALYAPTPIDVIERIEGDGDEICTASDELIYTHLKMMNMPDSWYDTASYAEDSIVDELRKSGHIHLRWCGEAGSPYFAHWHAESQYGAYQR